MLLDQEGGLEQGSRRMLKVYLGGRQRLGRSKELGTARGENTQVLRECEWGFWELGWAVT